MSYNWGRTRYREPETTIEFVNEQGIVFVFCPCHLDGRQYIRYLIIGYIFIDDPTLKHFNSAREYFPDAKALWIESPCPLCKRVHEAVHKRLPQKTDVV